MWLKEYAIPSKSYVFIDENVFLAKPDNYCTQIKLLLTSVNALEFWFDRFIELKVNVHRH